MTVRRRLLVALLVAGLPVWALAVPPALSVNTECVGQGTLHLTAQIGYQSPEGVLFTWTAPNMVGCVSFTMSGSMLASCERMSGSGALTIDGTSRTFNLEMVGGVLTLTGGAVGTGYLVESAGHGDNCRTGTADDFLMTLAVHLRSVPAEPATLPTAARRARSTRVRPRAPT